MAKINSSTISYILKNYVQFFLHCFTKLNQSTAPLSEQGKTKYTEVKKLNKVAIELSSTSNRQGKFYISSQ